MNQNQSRAALVPVVDEYLELQDSVGNRRTYNLTDLALRYLTPQQREGDKAVPLEDIAAFALRCRITGANPAVGEAFLIPFEDSQSGRYRAATVFSIHFWRRVARQSGIHDGTAVYLCDDDEKPLSAMVDIAQVGGAIAEVHIKHQKLPVRVVVPLREVRKARRTKAGEVYYTGMWKDDNEAKHMLKVRAEARALQAAFEASVVVPVGAPLPPHAEEQVVRAEEEIIEAEYIVEQAAEGGQDQEQGSPAVIGEEGERTFYDWAKRQEAGPQFAKLVNAFIASTWPGANRVAELPAADEHKLHEWAAKKLRATPPQHQAQASAEQSAPENEAPTPDQPWEPEDGDGSVPLMAELVQIAADYGLHDLAAEKLKFWSEMSDAEKRRALASLQAAATDKQAEA